ncbi:protein phtf [Tribolium castaneum]|uniref:Homeodomain transcription factor-like Protein n=1 Tax=Tribolium castaneum TaxID=7070 RepID=D6W9N1_TRICA|nr:PREDICTED: putative homeodomain transcription factor [Tribolium castaneum]EEZ98518.1 Putative homeodomain transcription factor-like Protein [Tribolium castaneum]|eukprot:XP_973928.2 PREDICTED: putative homeodomain transcription factor [Tribolium castaneum]
MGVKDLFTWYQKKIGTYDKQKWETTIEQKILYGLTHVQMKSTKPNTDFIDLDLVRGSSFSKIKPKQGFMTVAKLATFRCLFLPIYSKWWMQQTSVSIFTLMFCLYVSQLTNIAIYYKNSWTNQMLDKSPENVMCMELIVPFLMTWVLSLVHSQIAATMPVTDSQKTKLTKSRNFRRRLSAVRKIPTDGSSAESLLNLRIHKKNKRIHFNLNSVSELNCKEINKNLRKRRSSDGVPADDDGFESLNGNGSRTSEEEIVPTACKNALKRCDEWVKKQSLSNISTESRHSTEPESDVDESDVKRAKYKIPTINITSMDSTCDTDDEYEKTSIKTSKMSSSTNEWMNVTTNSEDCSYSSDLDEVSDGHIETNHDDYDHDLTSTAVFNPPSIKVSCIIWKRNEIKKADLSMLDISSAIIGKVESTSQSMDYFYLGIIVSTIHAFIPILFRVCNSTLESNSFVDGQYSIFELFDSIMGKLPNSVPTLIEAAFGTTLWERAIIITACLQRWFLASLFFFLLAVAENTFKQRFLYAKLFSHLTSFRRAQQSELPHFRLNKVRNIKTWLSVRSYLKQRGPQRSVDVIVSTAFIITLLLLSFLCVELLKETGALNSQYHVEALIWCLGVGILLLRFMTLGNKINKKYRNLSVLITEQINLHLQIEQKPQKKEELALANNVLKLAIDLIKELQSPFKISGLSANSILYNTTKLIILSALSGILSELLGFKLKLHKIKIK